MSTVVEVDGCSVVRCINQGAVVIVGSELLLKDFQGWLWFFMLSDGVGADFVY